MKRDLLLVIDMQNAYAKGGVWCCPNAETAAGNINRILDEKEADVIFTQFLAEKSPEGTWKEYNRVNASINQDAYANEMMEVFSKAKERYPIYQKSTYSSFEIPEVREAAKKADRVILTGVVAECCVLATAFALIDAGVKVIYLSDGVAGIDEDTEKATIKVLEGLVPAQVEIMTTEQYLMSRGKGEH